MTVIGRLILFTENEGGGREFVFIDTQALSREELEKEYDGKVVEVVLIKGDVCLFPTDRALVDEARD